MVSTGCLAPCRRAAGFAATVEEVGTRPVRLTGRPFSANCKHHTAAHMTATPAALRESPLYMLERFEAGVIHLDAQRHVVGMNDFARRVLPVDDMAPFDRYVLDFHPDRSKPKVAFMLDQAAQCPVSNPPLMTMIINIPERVLLIKVSRLSDGQRRTSGYMLIFYDITEAVAEEGGGLPAPRTGPAGEAAPEVGITQRRRLSRIPTTVGQRIVLVDVDDVLAIESDGHYTQVRTQTGTSFCNLSITDLATRLDPERFMRVHRSHVVNITHVRQVLRSDGRLQLGLSDQSNIPVSRASVRFVLDKIGLKG